jgi:transcriptional regulator with XRE-family HTH domain
MGRKPNEKLKYERVVRGWSQFYVANQIDTNKDMISRWERGERTPNRYYQAKLCGLFGKTAQDLGFLDVTEVENSKTFNLSSTMESLPETTTSIISRASFPLSSGQINQTGIWADELLTIYAHGIAACQDLYFNGNPYQVEAILPLYRHQTMQIARQPSPLQQSAARIASLAQLLTCELATDREDFGSAKQAGEQAFQLAQLAGDLNLQVAALINLANLSFHRKITTIALQTYQHAVSLFNETVTPLLKGRTYAGIAEVYAMQNQLQEAMLAMGLAYEYYPIKPEADPAYPYLRATRYSLYVFGDAQSRLFLKQPKEAEKALITMQRETNDPQIEPITKLDLLYYQANVCIQQGDLETSNAIMVEAATLAKNLGSRLYFNKLATSYSELQREWPGEHLVAALEEIFQSW